MLTDFQNSFTDGLTNKLAIDITKHSTSAFSKLETHR